MLPPEELLEEWRREDEEAREIRRRHADWKFIEKQPPKIRYALKYYIEKGDLWVASRLAGLTADEFNELRIKAKIPEVT
ncbi:MAG: hypothetical protein DRN96_09845 [Thermoproteota archaeon]|nr:MAG: hypothetical protein DRN96_09845 [Candidatus Korarchaeota archaeon]